MVDSSVARPGGWIINRVRGLWRDAWWLLVILVVAAGIVALTVSAAIGITIGLVAIVVFVYFAILRYDDLGRERQ